MKIRRVLLIAAAVVPLITISGCQLNPKKQVLAATESQVQLRSMQTRVFESSDKNKVMRSAISTLQDLDFIVDNADLLLGSVSGTKFGKSGAKMYQLKMTVSVRPRGDKQMVVRANAQYNLEAIEDPKPYQDFFTALGKSLFLTAQQVD